MFCQRCGSQFPDGMSNCPNCGMPVNNWNNQPQHNNQRYAESNPWIWLLLGYCTCGVTVYIMSYKTITKMNSLLNKYNSNPLFILLWELLAPVVSAIIGLGMYVAPFIWLPYAIEAARSMEDLYRSRGVFKKFQLKYVLLSFFIGGQITTVNIADTNDFMRLDGRNTSNSIVIASIIISLVLSVILTALVIALFIFVGAASSMGLE